MGRQQGELPLPQNKKKSSDDIFIKLAEMTQTSFQIETCERKIQEALAEGFILNRVDDLKSAALVQKSGTLYDIPGYKVTGHAYSSFT